MTVSLGEYSVLVNPIHEDKEEKISVKEIVNKNKVFFYFIIILIIGFVIFYLKEDYFKKTN